MIARQRYNLNQTMRLESRSKVRLDLAQVEKVAAFQTKLATQTHDLAEFLAGLGVDVAALAARLDGLAPAAVDLLVRDEERTRAIDRGTRARIVAAREPVHAEPRAVREAHAPRAFPRAIVALRG